MELRLLSLGTGSGRWRGGQHAEIDRQVTTLRRRLTKVSPTSMVSSSSFHGLIIALLLLTSIATAASAQPCYGRTCPDDMICIFTELGDPEAGVPHVGYCGHWDDSPKTTTYCRLRGQYFAVGLGGIPKGDGCNTCVCMTEGRLGCTKIGCGRTK